MQQRSFPLYVCFLTSLTIFLAMLPFEAQSTEYKVKGLLEISASHVNRHFLRSDAVQRQPEFNVFQRYRMQLEAVSSPTLSATVVFDMDAIWGSNNNLWTPTTVAGGALGTDGYQVKLALAYVDWTIPHTDIRTRVGKQYFWTPGLVSGSAVLVERGYGISWNIPVNEHFSVDGFWVRARNDDYDRQFPRTGSEWTRPSDDSLEFDNADFFSLKFNLRGDDFQLIPWVAYGTMGRNSPEMTREVVAPAVWANTTHSPNSHQEAWYMGVTGEYKGIEPFRFAFDFNYATLKGVTHEMNRAGWFAAASAEYKFLSFTPRLTFWYSSGDDANIKNGSERMPSITASWWTSSFGHSAYWKNGASHGYNADNAHTSPVGLMGITLELDQIRFMDDLMQVLRISYERGTNAPGMAKYIRPVNRAEGNFTNTPLRNDYAGPYNFNSLLYLTSKDSFWEFNLDTVYTIYENLKFVFEIGVMYLELDEKLWATNKGYDKINHRIGANFIYTF